jgi:outer membrane lipoprotein LolB
MRAWLAAGCCALGLGCAALPAVSPSQDAGGADDWHMQGRIAVQTAEQSLSGTIHWRHQADTDDLLLTSPLGQGVARILRNAEGVTLEVPNQPSRHARDAEELTRDALGVALPVSGLGWWVRARAVPGRTFEMRRDALGRAEQIRQDGWVIDYLLYPPDSPDLPRKLVATRDGLEIRLVVDHWKTP